MQFLLVAYDANDDDALNRRMQARAAHITYMDKNKEAGHAHFGAAIIEDGKMVGSMMVVEYETKEALDAWLNEEPYVVHKVWDEINISECQIGPSFVKTA